MSDRILVGRRADEDVPNILRVDLGVLAEFDVDLLVEGVDKKVKHLVLCECVGCLVGLHHPIEQPVHLTRFVNY